jgi:NADPH-dependent curcumin reductase CurA
VANGAPNLGAHPEDFELTEVHLSQPAAGQVLTRVLMSSLDPYLAHSMQTWTGETLAWKISEAWAREAAIERINRSQPTRERQRSRGRGRDQGYGLEL